MSKKKKEFLFWLLTISIGLFNMQFFHFENYFLRLLIRIPQVIFILWMYRKFVDNDIMKMTKVRYKLKGVWHWIVFVAGLMLFIFISIGMHSGPQPNYTPEQTWALFVKLIQENILSTIISIIGGVTIALPMAYTLIHGALYLRNITLWFYVNKKYLFIPFLILEDVVITGLLSLAT